MCVCVCRSRTLRTPANMFIINLALTDFLMCATQAPIFFTTSMHKRWIFGEKGTKKRTYMVSLASRCCGDKPLSPDLRDALATDASGCSHLASRLARLPPLKEIEGLRSARKQASGTRNIYIGHRCSFML